MSIDSSLVSAVIRNPETFRDLRRAGITEDHLTDDWAKAWKWISKTYKSHGTIPSKSVFGNRFPQLEIHKVKSSDIPVLLTEVRQRRKWLDFLQTLEEGSRVGGPDEIDAAIAEVQREMNSLAIRGNSGSMIDLFSKEAKKRILADQKRRRRDEVMGLPTGLMRFDAVTGGLQPGRLIVVMARPGIGKSWLNLLFVASSVMKGAKVGLYPLEMTLEDTALRLYSIFSCRMFKGEKTLKNLDLVNGKITKRKIVKFLNVLEDKYSGQLYVADAGAMSDPMTVERVEAEHEIYGFDMQWIDYLTLMKAPGVGRDGGEDHTTVKALSNGCKQIAARHHTIVGVSAQVSRQAISGNALLPRLEHIAYGDSIGQDADHVIAMNRRGEDLYYGVVKNRHGPEIGKTRVKWAVNSGQIEDDKQQDATEEED